MEDTSGGSRQVKGRGGYAASSSSSSSSSGGTCGTRTPTLLALQQLGPTSYPAATYTNDKYGFSIQYPKDWVARPELVTTPEHLAAFGVAAFVPGVVLYAYDADAPESADWIVASLKKTGNTDPKVKSDIKEETLAGGIKAYTYQSSLYFCIRV